MQPFMQFLLRFNGLLAVLFLGGISSYAYFNRNLNDNKAAFLSSANALSGGVYEYSSWVWRYWNLSVVNDSLARENVRLRMLLPSSRYPLQVDSMRVQDSLYTQQYRYTAATVVSNSINKARNFLTINRGSLQGVRPGSAVVNGLGQGIVGIVVNVSSHYASVMSIFHKEARISARIARNNYFGTLLWTSEDLTHLNIESLPKHADLRKGDTLLTSGFSTIFPQGILVGTLDTFYVPPGSNFYTGKVRLFNDLSKVQQVYIIDDLHREEKDSLRRQNK